MFLSLKIFFSDPNNQKFFGGLLLLLMITYIFKGESPKAKFLRFVVLAGIALLIFFSFSLVSLYH